MDLKDCEFRTLADLVALLEEENQAQLKKWGVQIASPPEWMLFLTEEVGELAQAIAEHEYRQGSKEDVIKEAVQVATLALKIVEMYRDPEQGDQ